jgi:hypothetical protein
MRRFKITPEQQQLSVTAAGFSAKNMPLQLEFNDLIVSDNSALCGVDFAGSFASKLPLFILNLILAGSLPCGLALTAGHLTCKVHDWAAHYVDISKHHPCQSLRGFQFSPGNHGKRYVAHYARASGASAQLSEHSSTSGCDNTPRLNSDASGSRTPICRVGCSDMRMIPPHLAGADYSICTVLCCQAQWRANPKDITSKLQR